jgi:hypothetical protein
MASCNEFGETSDGGLWAENNSQERLLEIYYFTVIDILQPYNTFKSLEHSMKSLVYDNVRNTHFSNNNFSLQRNSSQTKIARNICRPTGTIHRQISKVYCFNDRVNNTP